MKNYTELDVWQRSRSLANLIYALTKGFPKDELFSLTSQMRRSAVSVPSNIAEGCGRQHVNDAVQLFYIARGSLYELETQLFISSDQRYITEPELKNCLEEITACKQMLNGFIKYYKGLNLPKPGQRTTNNDQRN